MVTNKLKLCIYMQGLFQATPPPLTGRLRKRGNPPTPIPTGRGIGLLSGAGVKAALSVVACCVAIYTFQQASYIATN